MFESSLFGRLPSRFGRPSAGPVAAIDPTSPGLLISAIIGGQLVTAMIDFGTLGLASGEGLDLGRWLLLAPGLAFGLFLALTSAPLTRWLLRGPSLLMALWLVWSLAGVGWSLTPRTTALQMVPASALFLSSFWYVRRYGLDRYATVFTSTASVVMAAGLVLDYLPPFDTLLTSGQSQFALDSGRRPGLTPGVNQLALLAGLNLILLARVSVAVPLQRVLRLASYVVSITVVIVAGSRSVLACTAVALLLQYGLPATGTQRRRWSGLILASGVIVTGLVLSVGSPTTFQSGRSLDSLNGREDVWRAAVTLAERSPVTGLGMMSGDVTWRQAFFDGRTRFDANDAHNTLLEVLIGTGSVGLVLFASALVWAGIRSVRLRQYEAVALLTLVVLVGFTEALVSAASFPYAILGLIFGLVARQPDAIRIWTPPQQLSANRYRRLAS